MKISTFNPQIITSDAESIVNIFETLGFERRHQQEGIGDLDVTGIRMKDSNGNYVDISEVDIGLKEDMLAIRMNTGFPKSRKLFPFHKLSLLLNLFV